MKFQKVHRDTNHIEIVNDLRKDHDYAVVDLAAVGRGVSDIIVAEANVTALIEIKRSDGEFYLTQLEFLADWPGVAGFAETTQDCLRLMRDPAKYRLSDSDKKIIKMICAELRADDRRTGLRPRCKVTKFNKLFDQLKTKLQVKKCPKCGHQPHGKACFNIQSDNDCDCKYESD